ncbi:hypothetical protein BH23ACT10_BH23ACT10_39870 [soil metagenome]
MSRMRPNDRGQRMSLVLDTGPVLALLDADDPDHARCARLIDDSSETLVVPAATLVEIDYWCRKLLDITVWRSFVDDIANGAYRLVNLDAEGYQRASELEEQYAHLRLGVVDAAVIATCEALGEDKVVTLDHRHFTVVKPMSGTALRLLP